MNNNTVKADNGTEVYTHEIYEAVDDYRVEKNIDDLCTISQSRWNSVLLYIYDKVYKGTTKLKIDGNKNNTYDQNKLSDVFEIYKRLCYEYEKEISLKGFCKITGVTEETMNAWCRKNDKGFSSSGSVLHQKIAAENEESIVQLMESGKRNPMCYMPVLNHRHGWNMPGVNNGQQEERKSLEQIREERGLELHENETQLPPPAPPEEPKT